MVAPIDLTEEELSELKDVTNQSDVSEAIRFAIKDYIRYIRRMQLKKLSGKVEMQDNWQELEQRELAEQSDDAGAGTN